LQVNTNNIYAALLYDASVSSNEPVENFDIETIPVSERQKAPPEKGCYITGLHLYGAGFDNHKNCLKPAKCSDEFKTLPPVKN
jgi:hypothetical protein